jgi:ABC-type bacteriocin/lantibiotic exporter with double-glycine peptidase domain
MRFLIFVLIVSLTSFAGAEMSSLENATFSQCGINCLYLCLKYHQINENIDDIYAAVKPDEENNVSLKQLAKFAKTRGLYVRPVIKPVFGDVEKALTGNRSIILQYALDLPDKTKFKHIVALVKPDRKILLLDYPAPAYEIKTEDLKTTVSNSEGMLVVSPQPIINFAEFLNGKTLKSLSFYAIAAGLIIAGFLTVKSFRKTGKTKEI